MFLRKRFIQVKRYRPRSRRLYGLTDKDALNFCSSLIPPIMLGVFTICITIYQLKLAREQRSEDVKLVQDQRQQELTIAKMEQQSRNNISIMDEQSRNKVANNRYQDEVLMNYIKEIGDLLEKTNGSLTVSSRSATLARVKTLNVLRQLDGSRQNYVIHFLYEAEQLRNTDEVVALDISTAKLTGIDFRSSNRLIRLALNSVHLENCIFDGQVFHSNFSSTTLNDVKFLPNRLILVNFLSARLNHVNFSYARLVSVNYSAASLVYVNYTYAQLDNVNFSSALLGDSTFSSARLNRVNFSSARFFYVNYSAAELKNVNFSSARLNDVNYTYAELQNVNFSSARPNRVNFSSARLLDVNFSAAWLVYVNYTYAQLENVNFSSARLADSTFSSAQLENVNFSSVHLKSVNFSSAWLNRVNFSSAWLKNVNYSAAEFENVNFSSTRLLNVNYTYAELKNVNFSSAWLRNVNFSFAQLYNVSFSSVRFNISGSNNFHHASMAHTVFVKCDCIIADFGYANLSMSVFWHANLKNVSFHSADLTKTNFSLANLQEADFTNTSITDSQLQSALSIRNTKLPNGTLGRGQNLVKNGDINCNIFLIDRWQVRKCNMTAMTSKEDRSKCQFILQSNIFEAVMSQRIRLEHIWDSSFWTDSDAELQAEMSSGLSIELIGWNSKGAVLDKQIANSTKNKIIMKLQTDMQELEVVVKINAHNKKNNNQKFWCDNIELFISYDIKKTTPYDELY